MTTALFELSVIDTQSFRQHFLEVHHLIQQWPYFLQVFLELLQVGLPVCVADAERVEKRAQNNTKGRSGTNQRML